MKKTISIIAIIALVAVLGVCLVACNTDSYKNKLEKKDYAVTVIEENSGLVKTINDFMGLDGGYKGKVKWAVLGINGLNYANVIKFEKSADAKKFYENSWFVNNAESKYRTTSYVIYGTAKGVKDAK